MEPELAGHGRDYPFYTLQERHVDKSVGCKDDKRSREQVLGGNATETKPDLPTEKITGEMLTALKYLKGFWKPYREKWSIFP